MKSTKNTRLIKIIETLVNEINPRKLVLFGSRGKGNTSFNSDYDIAVDSEIISISEKRKLKEKIDEIIGLYNIDIIFLKEVDPDFKNIILKTGRIIYEG
jgi:predicted nucleotidyltransferase